jgi:hypothetical protein
MALRFLTYQLDGGERSAERFGYPTFEERASDTQLIGNWAVPKTDLDFLGNRKPLMPLPGMESHLLFVHPCLLSLPTEGFPLPLCVHKKQCN